MSSSKYLDKIAIALSAICIVHCLAITLFVAMLPLATAAFGGHFHGFMLWLVIPTSIGGFYLGYREHKRAVIGIGAGDQCDGQVRVTADLIGLTDKQPPFAQPLIQTRELCIKALKDWVNQKENSSKPRTTSTSEQESDY